MHETDGWPGGAESEKFRFLCRVFSLARIYIYGLGWYQPERADAAGVGMGTNEHTTSDGQLIAMARSDPAAFAKLYRRHYDGIFRYCSHRLFDRSAGEDVTSKVFLKVVENFELFTGDGHDFRNWLYRIATNAVNEHLRKAYRDDRALRRAAQDIARGSGSCEAPADDMGEKRDALGRALLALKRRYQAIIVLRFFENMKLSEIAAILGSGPATVRSQLSRALAALRKAMPAGPKDAGREV